MINHMIFYDNKPLMYEVITESVPSFFIHWEESCTTVNLELWVIQMFPSFMIDPLISLQLFRSSGGFWSLMMQVLAGTMAAEKIPAELLRVCVCVWQSLFISLCSF